MGARLLREITQTVYPDRLQPSELPFFDRLLVGEVNVVFQVNRRVKKVEVRDAVNYALVLVMPEQDDHRVSHRGNAETMWPKYHVAQARREQWRFGVPPPCRNGGREMEDGERMFSTVDETVVENMA